MAVMRVGWEWSFLLLNILNWKSSENNCLFLKQKVQVKKIISEIFSEVIGSQHQGYTRDRAVKIKSRYVKIMKVKHFSLSWTAFCAWGMILAMNIFKRLSSVFLLRLGKNLKCQKILQDLKGFPLTSLKRKKQNWFTHI